MKSPSRRLRRLVGAGTAALLAVGLAPIVTSGVAQAASTNTPAISVSDQTVIGVGDRLRRGNINVGSAARTFTQGTITVQVAQPGVGTPIRHPFRHHPGDERELQQRCRPATMSPSRPRDPRSAVHRRLRRVRRDPDGRWPHGRHPDAASWRRWFVDRDGTDGTVPGFCNGQDGGTADRHLHLHGGDVRSWSHRDQQHPVRRWSWHRNGEPSGPTTRLNSTTTGPARLFISFTNVSTGSPSSRS